MNDSFGQIVQEVSNWAIPVIFVLILGYGALRKVRVYEVFIEGAKEGFNVAIRIIPYLVAILVAIGIFRGSGAMDWIIAGLTPILKPLGVAPEVLPMAIIKPLSGSGALGVMTEGLKTYGPDSLIGNTMSTMMGSTETTFYVLAVYFGSVAVRRTRHAVLACLLGDLAGLAMAVFICNVMFG